MNRDQNITRLESRKAPWDVVIIGGGATGVYVALEAATRGLDTLLLEQSDFGKGTSSRSTKLVHGGVRYLKQGNIKLVTEALHERALLHKNAPHLVKDLAFLIPCRSRWERFFYGTGLKVYDYLAGRDRFAASSSISSEQALNSAPGTKPSMLKGGVIYHDGQFDDARLLLSIAQTASSHDACLLNYFAVKELKKSSTGSVVGVVVEDQETGQNYQVNARCVINATGPFSDAVRKLDDATQPEIIAPSQGVHLVVSREFFPGETALIVPKTSDGRVIFIIPWHDRIIIGTTDTLIPDPLLEPIAQAEEIEFLIETANRYLTKEISVDDILSIYTGIRPLVKNKSAGATAAISRDHLIQVSDSGMITIAGGKWTTARKMAEDCVETATSLHNLQAKASSTQDVKLHGYQETAGELTHRSVYGTDLVGIEEIEASHPETAIPICEELPIRPSEVIWAARQEMARTVDDVLARRTRMLFLNAKATLNIAPTVAEILAKELDYDQQWCDNQFEEFKAICKRFLPEVQVRLDGTTQNVTD